MLIFDLNLQANEDPEAIMHHCNMMMSSHGNNNDVFDFDDVFQPSSDTIFAINNSVIIKSNIDFESVMETKITPSINSCWSPSGQIISFGNSGIETKSRPNKKELNNSGSKGVGSTSNKDHVVAERVRREKMIQGFVALSALIPGLKKVLILIHFFANKMHSYN